MRSWVACEQGFRRSCVVCE